MNVGAGKVNKILTLHCHVLTSRARLLKSIVARHSNKMARRGVSTRVSEVAFKETPVSDGGNQQISARSLLDMPKFCI